MIIGLGQDIADIRRIERTLEKFGERFIRRVFTDTEIAKAEKRRRKAETYAKRFAAKEACAKALGTGVPKRGVYWRDMGVVNLPGGRPTVVLSGGAADRLKVITPKGMEAQVHLTITDDYPYAQAMVIIEARPAPFATTPGNRFV